MGCRVRAGVRAGGQGVLQARLLECRVRAGIRAGGQGVLQARLLEGKWGVASNV